MALILALTVASQHETAFHVSTVKTGKQYFWKKGSLKQYKENKTKQKLPVRVVHFFWAQCIAQNIYGFHTHCNRFQRAVVWAFRVSCFTRIRMRGRLWESQGRKGVLPKTLCCLHSSPVATSSLEDAPRAVLPSPLTLRGRHMLIKSWWKSPWWKPGWHCVSLQHCIWS